ncbi:MAG: DUF2169 domain-containing protein [Polyangiaceae bacterium]
MELHEPPSSVVAKSVPDGRAKIEVRVRGPFAVGVALWRDESARVFATVVAKVTHRLTPGTTTVVEPPDPIRERDVYADDGDAGRLQFASDLAPFKAAHEVLVVGHLRANQGSADGSRTARIAIGEIQKELEVGAADGGPLVGFGPVSPSWPLRDALLRPEDRDWLLDPLRRPRPRAFDPRFFCSAPLDQRSSATLRADERLALDGLDPEHSHLVTTLTGIAPRLRCAGSAGASPSFVADTLCVDVDRRIATLAFRAIVPLGDAALEVEVEDGRSASGARVDDATTELDRNALKDVLSAIPFPPASERSRAHLPNTDDGALPFRPSTPPPPVMTPSESASEPAPAPPSAPRSTVGQLHSVGPVAALAAKPADSHVDAAPRGSDGKDRFRKAFGGAKSAADVAKPVPAAPPAVAAAAPETPSMLSILKAATTQSAEPGSVKAASDAALASAPRSAGATSPIGERSASAVARRVIVDLLAFDPAVPKRLRRSKVHAPLLVDAEPLRAPRKVDDPAGEADAQDRARLDVLRVLSSGSPLAMEEIDASFEALLDDPIDFELPLYLVAGEIRPSMDEIETLKVAVDLAKPLAGVNKRVLAAISAIGEALGRSAPLVSDGAATLWKRLDAATAELSLPPRHFADLVERTLLEARSYKRRTLLGAPRIRAEIALGRTALPIYLPESVGAQLPLLPAFPCVALVELRPREDAFETHPTALVAFALGRVLRARK